MTPIITVSNGVLKVELTDFTQINSTLNILKKGIESLDYEEIYEICGQCGESDCTCGESNEN